MMISEVSGIEEIYLVTGATGFLGREVVKKLVGLQKNIVGLRLPGDKAHLLPGVEYQMGDITKPYTLKKFFEMADGKKAVLIHCAGLVTIASEEERAWSVNVDGTRNIVDLCEKYNIHMLIYVSSVHAIEEMAKGQIICETKKFSASKVKGIYGKSKAEAASYVQKASERGLHTVIVHPSGLLGPEDYSGSYMTEMIKAFCKGYFPCAVEGGYDFVDVRDVADGIIRCIEDGKSGETYILSGEYITIKKMFDILANVSGKHRVRGAVPIKVVGWIAPFCEKIGKAVGNPMLITPYSVYTLGSNGNFSHKKAEDELGYLPRPIEETLADVALWLQKEGA